MCSVCKRISYQPVRDAAGRPLPYVDPARSPELDGQWFAYRPAAHGGWEVVGRFDSETDARKAAGLGQSHEITPGNQK